MTSVQTTAKQWVCICFSYCTDVDEVAFAVQHDVAIVSVFDLQQEQQEAVGGHAADEVIPSLWTGEEDIRNIVIWNPEQNCDKCSREIL